MAWFGDPTWIAQVLRDEGLVVTEVQGWQNRGHGDFREVKGVLGHHTAGGGSNDWRIVLNGRPDLPGPLAQLVLEKDGSYKVICVGVAWHAGRGSAPGITRNDGNFELIGIEAVSRGTRDANGNFDWTPVQLDAYKRGVAAILRKLGKSAQAGFWGHLEYSAEGKIDPAGIDLAQFRREVQDIIDRKPGGKAVALDEKLVNDASFQWGKPHQVRKVFQKTFYNVKEGEMWGRAGLADIWNEVVWDGFVNPVDLLDGKADPDNLPPGTPADKVARRGSLISYVLATYRDAAITRRNTEKILKILEGK